MIIAISQRNDINKHGDKIDNLENNYINYFEKFGAKLITLPNSSENIEDYLNEFKIDAIIISGGNDINPEFYGERLSENLSISKERDHTESKLLDFAIKKKIPVLGICRGMQFINAYFNGKLSNVGNHVARDHPVKITNEDVKQLIGEEIQTNSYHNQAIKEKDLSKELAYFAVAQDNIIEGIYHPNLPIVGIQWHPERSIDSEANKKIVKAFLNRELFWKAKTKAIILAAGMGTRLGRYTENLPKCMLKFAGKTLIERQVETLRSCGIEDIIIVRGFMPEKIQIPEAKYYVNKDYADTNMVETLMKAEEEMNSNVLVCYADILYEEKVIKKILADNSDIGVCVDENYWDYWASRLDRPEEDIESLITNAKGQIIDIGEPSCSLDKAKLRYVGLIKFSDKGTKIFKEVYQKNKATYFNKGGPWLRSKSFRKAYMTCMLQAIINEGHDINPIIINRGWMEFDNVEDYEKANKWLNNGTINKFIHIS